MHFTLSILLLFLFFNKTNAIRSDYSNSTITPLAQTNLGWRYLLAYCKCITNNSGVWGTTEWCDEGQFAYGFQLNVQQQLGSAGDDTALNGVRLYCKSVFLEKLHKNKKAFQIKLLKHQYNGHNINGVH
jgi:hypothetical protein